ncbi:MAG: hypothetical protein AB1405_14470 [Bdellovibrionota bacterium]
MNPVSFTIQKGNGYVQYAYDVASWIRLDECQRHIAATPQPSGIRQKSRAPEYFDYSPPPLRVTVDGSSTTIGKWRTAPGVDLVLYDFGAVCVNYTIPFEGSLEELRELSYAIADTEALRNDSRKRIETLLATIASATVKPNLVDLAEDYFIFQVLEWSGSCPVAEVPAAFSSLLAQILRSESSPLSPEEVTDAISGKVSFSPDDLLLIDWNAALLFDPEADDVRAVLEFANVELVELRFLDSQLDRSLDGAYEILSQNTLRTFSRPGARAADMRRVAQLQVDGALLFERVSNALKLMGDQYLARVYRLASQRFRLSEWNATILRKLDALESIYQKLSDRADARQMAILEWIIIALIAVSTILPFLPWYPH